ncbi:MAG: hypothetical protein GXY91_05550 [Clostridia bacterium]|nr:hypothetical protein [Clostridia bacterium]
MLTKTIAVQEGLHEIAEKLRELGYNVVGVDELNYPVDAIVYSSSLSDAPNKIHSMEMGAANNDGFVLMLNKDEFTFDELINQLKEL